MNQPIDLNPIKARAIAATTDTGTALERAKAAAEFRHHAAADVLRLVEEVERLQAERENHTLIHNDALAGLVAENERLRAGNTFSCGCHFSSSQLGWEWDFCDIHAKSYLMQKEVERLRELSQELSNQLQATQAELEQLQIEADAYDKYIKGGLSLGQLEKALKGES